MAPHSSASRCPKVIQRSVSTGMMRVTCDAEPDGPDGLQEEEEVETVEAVEREREIAVPSLN